MTDNYKVCVQFSTTTSHYCTGTLPRYMQPVQPNCLGSSTFSQHSSDTTQPIQGNVSRFLLGPCHSVTAVTTVRRFYNINATHPVTSFIMCKTSLNIYMFWLYPIILDKPAHLTIRVLWVLVSDCEFVNRETAMLTKLSRSVLISLSSFLITFCSE